MGTHDRGATLSHAFILQNTGDAPLRIHTITPSCSSCTTVSHSKADIAPGKSLTLNATLSLTGIQSPYYKTILVESNDPQQPRLTLGFKGRAVSVIEMHPKQLVFAHTNENQLATQVVRLTRGKDTPFTVAKTTVSNPDDFELSLQPSDNGTDLRITSKGFHRPGYRKATLSIHTDAPSQPILYVPIEAALSAAPYHLSRQTLWLPSQTPTAPITIPIRLTPGRRGPFKILRMDTPDPRITASFSSPQDHHWDLRITGLPADPDLAGKQILIHTNLKQHPTIAITLKRRRFKSE